jgi:signal peptidase II
MKPSISLIIAFIVLALDFATKRWVEAALFSGQQIPVTNFFNLVLAYNAGAAFSFLSDADGWQRWFFSVVAAGASATIVYLLRKHAHATLFCAALSLILGGALGNLWDRISLGHVVDFLDFYIGSYHWPAFNVADSAIFLGAVLLIVDSFRGEKTGAGETVNDKETASSEGRAEKRRN